MKFCSKCGKELMDQAIICPNCGCSVVEPSAFKSNDVEDKVSSGLCALSALFPLFGLIYWCVKTNSTPNRAKACGFTALIMLGISLVFYFISAIIMSL